MTLILILRSMIDSFEERDLDNEMFLAIQAKDLEAVIDVIEEDEAARCKVAPKGIRKVHQISPLVNFEDPYGNYPLALACKIGAKRTVIGLILRGADSNFENKFGMTPLMVACQGGNANAVKALLRKPIPQCPPPAAVMYVNTKGLTAYDYVDTKSAAKILPLLDSFKKKQSTKFVRRIQQSQQGRLNKDEISLTELDSSEIDKELSDKLTDFNFSQWKKSFLEETVLLLMSKVHSSITKARTMTKKQCIAARDKVKSIPRKAVHVYHSVDSLNKTRRDHAASVIQQTVSSYLARKRLRDSVLLAAQEMQRRKKLSNYVSKIQRQYRNRLFGKAVTHLVLTSHMARRIQSQFRGYLERKGRNSVLKMLRSGKKLWMEKYRTRGWLSEYASRAEAVQWELDAKNANNLLARFLRMKVAQRKVKILRRELQSCIRLQKHIRGWIARAPFRMRELRFEFRSVLDIEDLKGRMYEMMSWEPILQLKKELEASNTICKLTKPVASALADVTQARLRFESASCLQRVFRGHLGRQRAKMFLQKQNLKLGDLKGCLSIRGLRDSGQGITMKGRGYCTKCMCRKFIESDRSEQICKNCTHHVVRHVGVFKSHFEDSQENNKLKPLNLKRYANAGENSEYDEEETISKPSCIFEKQLQQRQKDVLEKKRTEKVKHKLRAEIDLKWERDEKRMEEKHQLQVQSQKKKQENNQLKLLLRESQVVLRNLEKQQLQRDQLRINFLAEQRQYVRKIKKITSPTNAGPRSPLTSPNSTVSIPTIKIVHSNEGNCPADASRNNLAAVPMVPNEESVKTHVEFTTKTAVRKESCSQTEDFELIQNIRKLEARQLKAVLSSKSALENCNQQLYLKLHSSVDNLPRIIKLGARNSFIIGRAESSDIVLDSPTRPSMVSNRHCQLYVDKKHIYVTDLGSKNGTWVNHSVNVGNSKTALLHGDILTFGIYSASQRSLSSDVEYELRLD